MFIGCGGGWDSWSDPNAKPLTDGIPVQTKDGEREGIESKGSKAEG